MTEILDVPDVYVRITGFVNCAKVLVALMEWQKIAEAAGDDAFWKSDDDIVAATGVKIRAVQLSINYLCEEGFLSFVFADERSGLLPYAYRVDLEKIQQAVDNLPPQVT